MGAGQLPVTEEPNMRPPPTHNPVSMHTLAGENPPSNPRLPPQVAKFAEVCSQQQGTAYPAIFDLQESNITTTSERMDILASL